MRKPHRAATAILATIIAFPLFYSLIGTASADPTTNDDRTDSQAYTDARADYWQARADYYARKAATQAKKEAGGADAAAPANGGGDNASAAAAGATAAAPAAAAPVAVAAHDGYPTNAQLAGLRMCESTDRYGVNTGNGYYGAYQFSAVTWWWLGYSGYPNEASPAVQDQAVRDLYALMGWSPWPACSRYLGFQ